MAELRCEAPARAVLGEPASRSGKQLLWHCPHPERHKHGDRDPSLGVNPEEDIWRCWAEGVGGKGGWSLAAFIAGVSPDDKPAVKAWLREHGLIAKRTGKATKADGRGPCVATYVYTDVQGNRLCRKLRYEPGGNGKAKDFCWQRWENGAWVDGLGEPKILTPLYRVSKTINEPLVVLTEGEKDADKGASIGLPTATSGGTGSWREDHAECLRGKSAVIIADADNAGRIHAQKVAASLGGKAASVKVCEIPDAKDLADAIQQGWGRDDLLAWFESDPEWKPPSGAEILDSVMKFIRRFVSLSDAQARVVTLWTAHTHAFEAADCTPYLAINSPEKQSGKTRLLEVVEKIVMNPWLTGRTTAAALVRKIDGEHPTLLLDESDTAFQQEKEYVAALRGILDSGYRKSGKASLCIGQGAAIEVRNFHTFAAKAIAGIGRLPDTVQDRSLPIRLKRARRGQVERFREREAQREGSEIAARLAAWCAVNLEKLRQARPEIPAQLSDRQADTCEPLLAVADLAGGEWPESARVALVTLCGQAQADDGSFGVRLLQDIRAIFEEKQADEITSGQLCEALGKIETSPWGEWSQGKPITPTRLARMLKPFEIVPDRIGGKGFQARGYTFRQFEDAFWLYLPSETVNPSTDRINAGENEDLKPSTVGAVDTSEKAVSPNKDATVDGLTLSNRVQAGGSENPPLLPLPQPPGPGPEEKSLGTGATSEPKPARRKPGNLFADDAERL